MLFIQKLIALTAILLVSAIPLNINLGAYSPALVVGDGEISFGGAQNAAALMETLATGAVSAAQGGQPAPVPATPPTEGTPAAKEVVAEDTTTEKLDDAPASEERTLPSPPPAEKLSTHRLPREKKSVPVEDISTTIKRDLEENEKRAEQLKRDIAGFRESLNFAANAMKKQPSVELGTGTEGSGVGVIVRPGVSVPARSPAAGRLTPPAAGGEGAVAGRSVEEGSSEGDAQKRGITLLEINGGLGYNTITWLVSFPLPWFTGAWHHGCWIDF